MGASLRKSILSLVFVFAFTSLANAAEHFSFAGLDLSLTPQQMIDKGVINTAGPDSPPFGVITTVEPENRTTVVPGEKPVKIDHQKLSSSDLSALSMFNWMIYKEGVQLQKILSLTKEDLEIVENNALDNFKDYFDKVKYLNKEPRATIQRYDN